MLIRKKYCPNMRNTSYIDADGYVAVGAPLPIVIQRLNSRVLTVRPNYA